MLRGSQPTSPRPCFRTGPCGRELQVACMHLKYRKATLCLRNAPPHKAKMCSKELGSSVPGHCAFPPETHILILANLVRKKGGFHSSGLEISGRRRIRARRSGRKRRRGTWALARSKDYVQGKSILLIMARRQKGPNHKNGK